jgi:gliding motility-associated-like protein
LTLQFGEAPAARQVLGEVWPIEVTSFEPETFTYVVRPTFDAEDAGFDRLEILTHSRATAVHSIQIDGSAVDLTDFPVDIQDDRIITSFPKLHGEADSFKQLEVVFDVSVLRFGTQFSSWVFNSDDPDRIKQRIAPGNATFRFSADDISVRAPVGGDLLIDVRAEPSVFTPNGDGVNDKLVISYKLREVTAERPITVKIYDLMGRLATELPVYLVRSGEFQREWDGRNASGQVMPPGTYIFQLALEAEEKEQYMGLISIAY